MVLVSDNRSNLFYPSDFTNKDVEIGMGLTISGSMFLVLGCLLFFDRALLALGNCLFLGGITLLIGIQRTVSFFLRRSKIRGTLCFLSGITFVLFGWGIVGMTLEFFGIINLFSNFFPYILMTLRQLPIVGPILKLPVVSQFVNRLVGAVLPSHYDE